MILVSFIVVTSDGTEADKLSAFAYEFGCGGGPLLPDEFAYVRQLPRLLISQPSEDMVLAATSCLGAGVQAITLSTGIVSILDPAIVNARLSPDRTVLAGLVNNTLRQINLQTGDVTDYMYTGSDRLDQLGWTQDGRLIFTTVSERGQMVLAPQNEQLASDVLFGQMPEDVPLHSTAMHLYNPVSSTVVELWTMDGWRGVPVIMASDSAVYFSAIPDMEKMITALNAGKDFVNVVAVRPSSSIYVSTLEANQTPVLLIEGGEFPTLVNP